MEIIDKIVEFDKWCPKCQFKQVNDIKGEEPCNECLANTTNVNSTKPIKFKEVLTTTKKSNKHNEPKVQVQII